MVTQIGEWMEKEKQLRGAMGRGADAVIDPETLQQLRSLGYLGGKK